VEIQPFLRTDLTVEDALVHCGKVRDSSRDHQVAASLGEKLGNDEYCLEMCTGNGLYSLIWGRRIMPINMTFT